jgi:hypothetical protein
MFNKLITVLLFLSLNLITLSQYVPYKFHGERGRFETDYFYSKRRIFNSEDNRYEFIKHCRNLVWSKHEHTGDVYYYDYETKTWTIKQESGVFWYCYWSPWRIC